MLHASFIHLFTKNFLMSSRILICLLSFLQFTAVYGQKVAENDSIVTRPKLVVGLVVDQMRWDYLYRYINQYNSNGGFKRLLSKGFSCDNTFIPYTPTLTAAGHAGIYTGSVPAIHGITSNIWYDLILNKLEYCVEDLSVETVGAANTSGKASPENLLTTTISDEMRIAANFRNKVVGIAIKDRGAIIPAGHAATGAYWYDSKTGNFVTSTYYTKSLPAWVTAFNERKVADSLYALNWNILLPKNIYQEQCSDDDKKYERNPFYDGPAVFPYKLSGFAGKDYSKIAYTPQGNDLTFAMAEAAVKGENLGSSSFTDLLAVSLSSPDYIGHSFGPDSWEQLDDFARLDKSLFDFMQFLDNEIGEGNYIFFLSADHGVAHSTGFSKENKLPGRFFDDTEIVSELNSIIKTAFNVDSAIIGLYNYQIFFDEDKLDRSKVSVKAVSEKIIPHLQKHDAISNAFEISNLNALPVQHKLREMFINGYYPSRSGTIQVIPKPGNVEGNGIGTSHGLWNPYDSHIPLVWYGWGIKTGHSTREYYMSDIAPTLAALLHVQMPSGSIGNVIQEVIK